ncbi:DUF4330 family protein [Natronolimnobius baerhuensis]|uniref:DUF4330 domain-containing protein n=1 Tax=Natronolimnobius baerhuensis TaxID=253108 RepID=A0A202E4D3_9EURY|nr:DUF4330 family protein [Natronolimnobius baerhuensis]OVE83145.1 hypothetical protein B2G88_17190 [Natronolimnobius baerhuensis]
MDVIDDDGNLFGAVNVVDALVVLLVLAVVIAGVAAVGVLGAEVNDPDEDDENLTDTRYATLEIGTESITTAEAVTAGDELTAGNERLEITDTYAVRTASDDAHLTVRTEIEATAHDNGTLEFADRELTTGQNVSIETDAYDVTGTTTVLENDTADLPTTETDVVFEQTVDHATAEQIDAGDVSQIGDETTATLENVSVYPIAADQYRVIAGATLTTLEGEDEYNTVRYGNAIVEPDSSIAFATDGYTLGPTIRETGTTAEPGEDTTTTVEIDLEGLEDREASQFEPGLSETMGGDTWATITDVERDPASVIVETDDGDIHEREHPTQDDVTLTVELDTRETTLGTQFKGTPLRNGDSVYLDFGVTTIDERAWIID